MKKRIMWLPALMLSASVVFAGSVSAQISDYVIETEVDAEELAEEMGVTPVTSKPSRDNLIIQTQEARDLFDRITAEDYPTMEELENSEVVAQIDQLSAYYIALYGSTALIDTPERKQLREDVKEEFLKAGSARIKVTEKKGPHYVFDGELETGYQAELVLGLPAAGKSTNVAEPDSEAMKAFIFDCDVIKKLIPEYKASFGCAADAVHMESEMIQNDALEAFLTGELKGVNLICPVVSTDIDALFATFITPLEEAGYTVKAKFVDCDPTVSAAKNVARELRNGRIINSKVAFSFGDKPRQVYEQLCEMTNADGEPYVD